MSLLLPRQYCHVLNNDTGEVRTVMGPTRFTLAGNESLIGNPTVKTAVTLLEDEYLVIRDPYDETTKRYLMGERQVIEGPKAIYLAANSSAESPVKIHVLMKGQALRVQALAEHDGKRAGEIWQIPGPCKYIPTKNEVVLKTIDTVLINEGEGMYIVNTETSQKRLIRGPAGYLLKANEDFYQKKYDDLETIALGLPNSQDCMAKRIYLKKGQVICILDAEKKERVLTGPCSILLEPEEHVKVLQLAKGKPKIGCQIKAAIINLGPDFVSDKFEVQSKDNAALSMLCTYKWQFTVDEHTLHNVFSIMDFIGYSCSTMVSLIREEVAKHLFEDFHKNSVGLIRAAVFKNVEVPTARGMEKMFGCYFPEISLIITEIDVKEIKPVNEEINQLLNASIRNNMQIVCQKMKQDAELSCSKEKVKNEKELMTLKAELIKIQNHNLGLEKVERAKIAGRVKMATAEIDKQVAEVKEKGDSDIELERMKRISEMIDSESGKKYLQLVEMEKMSDVPQNWFVSQNPTQHV